MRVKKKKEKIGEEKENDPCLCTKINVSAKREVSTCACILFLE